MVYIAQISSIRSNWSFLANLWQGRFVPHMKIVDLSKLKPFADIKSDVAEINEIMGFWIVSLSSMDCSLDSEHILRVSSKYLQ